MTAEEADILFQAHTWKPFALFVNVIMVLLILHTCSQYNVNRVFQEKYNFLYLWRTLNWYSTLFPEVFYSTVNRDMRYNIHAYELDVRCPLKYLLGKY